LVSLAHWSRCGLHRSPCSQLWGWPFSASFCSRYLKPVNVYRPIRAPSRPRHASHHG
jgi:hypothetical protein